MAPEVVNRKGHGTTADWWSFGVLMVCGRKEGREGRKRREREKGGRRGKEGGKERREGRERKEGGKERREGRERKEGGKERREEGEKRGREKEEGRRREERKEGGKEQNNEWVEESICVIWRLLHLLRHFSLCAHTFSMRCSRGRYRSRGRTGKLQ